MGRPEQRRVYVCSEGAWVKDQNVLIEDGNITGYKVNVEVTFVLES
jgi:flavin-binding protein dodecin